jgi:hypothetical protein
MTTCSKQHTQQAGKAKHTTSLQRTHIKRTHLFKQRTLWVLHCLLGFAVQIRYDAR